VRGDGVYITAADRTGEGVEQGRGYDVLDR
jgi:hypothetical protein